MPDASFTAPTWPKFCGLDALGLGVTGQRREGERTVLACRAVEPDQWCHGCGGQGRPCGTIKRRLAHVPFGTRPTALVITVRRYRCAHCVRVWRQDTILAAPARAKISRAWVLWALEALVVEHLTVSRIAKRLDVAWDTANTVV